MARGKTGLDSNEYDTYLAKQARSRSAHSSSAERELRKRHTERRNANKGYEGWHFGLGDKPVKTSTKEEFKKALDDRGLMLRDDVRTELRK